MCGIIGYYSEEHDPYNLKMAADVFMQSKIRGLHSFGYSHLPNGRLQTERCHELAPLLDSILETEPREFIGHCRYSTSGDYHNHDNNQPIGIDEFSLVFNGVISMKTKAENEEIWGPLKTDNDGEIFIKHLVNGDCPVSFVDSIKGSFAGLWYQDNEMYFVRNKRRPAAYTTNNGAVYIASTKDILKRAGFESYEDLPALEEIKVSELL
jgi:glutamine phosphoribosylpyrophosphate amidotransferase